MSLFGGGDRLRYARYAIGELVVVIVGILCALQIDNWNESRKEVQQEHTYYCKIGEDLATDVFNIGRSLESLEARSGASRRMLKNLLEQEVAQSVILQDYLAAVRSIRYVPSRAAINDITSSGKLGLLRDQDLKKTILEHYTQEDVALAVIESNADRMNSQIFDTEEYTDFGFQLIDLYRDDFGEELLQLMPSSDWHRDPQSRLFRYVRDQMNLTVIVSARETQLLRDILSSTTQLSRQLPPDC